MIDAEQMDTFNMNAAQYRVYAAEHARERQLAQQTTTTYPTRQGHSAARKTRERDEGTQQKTRPQGPAI